MPKQIYNSLCDPPESFQDDVGILLFYLVILSTTLSTLAQFQLFSQAFTRIKSFPSLSPFSNSPSVRESNEAGLKSHLAEIEAEIADLRPPQLLSSFLQSEVGRGTDIVSAPPAERAGLLLPLLSCISILNVESSVCAQSPSPLLSSPRY